MQSLHHHDNCWKAARRIFATASIFLTGSLLLAGCISPKLYVDPTLGDVSPEHMHKPANVAPVQLLFEFQTKGATNTKATELLRPEVVELTTKSGLFSAVTDTPSPNGAVLSIVVNNVPEEGAASKGMKTGLTLGASGTMVTDYYVCTANYLPSPASAPIVKEEHHAIHTTIGNTAPPPNSVASPTGRDAVNTMLQQVVDHALGDLASDPAFK